MSGNLLNVVAKTIIKVDDEADDKKFTKNKRLNLQALSLKRIYSQFVLVKRMATPVFEMPSITPQKKKSQSLKMIPSDLINMMIDHVNLRDAINLRVTCKYFNKAISNLGPHVYRRVNVGDTYIVRNNKGEIHNKMKIFVGCIYHKTGTSIYLLFSDHKFTSVEEILIKNLEKRICFGSDISLKSIGHQRAQFPCTGNAKFPRPVLVHNFTPGRKLTIEKFPDVLDEKSANKNPVDLNKLFFELQKFDSLKFLESAIHCFTSELYEENKSFLTSILEHREVSLRELALKALIKFEKNEGEIMKYRLLITQKN